MCIRKAVSLTCKVTSTVDGSNEMTDGDVHKCHFECVATRTPT